MISAINANLHTTNYRPNFGNEKEEKAGNFIKDSIVTPLKKGGTATHTIASLLIPGLGQFLQDRNDTGLNHLVLKGGLVLLTGILSFTRSTILGIAGTLAHMAVNVYSAVDANKYGKAQMKNIKKSENQPEKQDLKSSYKKSETEYVKKEPAK